MNQAARARAPRAHPPDALLRAYAGGTPPRGARALVAAHLAFCDQCDGLVHALWDEQVGQDLDAAPPAPSTPSRFDDVWAAIEAREASRPPEAELLPGAALAELEPTGPWPWVPIGEEGNRVAVVHREPDGSGELRLVRLGPQTALPTHGHEADEHTVVLTGGFRDGEQVFEVGDWATAGPDTVHTPVAEPHEECWALVHVQSGPDRDDRP